MNITDIQNDIQVSIAMNTGNKHMNTKINSYKIIYIIL